MKKYAPIFLFLILVFTGFACNIGGKEATASPTTAPEVEVTESEPAATTEEPTSIPATKAVPTEAPTPVETEGPTKPGFTSSLAPGWYPYVNANVVRDLAIYDGVIHAATLGGLVTWRLDSFYSMQYTPLDGMGHVSTYAVAYCEIPEPRILVGTLSGISVYDPSTGLWEEFDLYPADSNLATTRIDYLYCDQANNRLLIGAYGLSVLDMGGGTYQRYTVNEGLLWDSVADIAVNGSDIWIANGYKGIARIPSSGEITNFRAENGMPDDYAYSLAFSPDGTLWVGASKGLISFKGNQWTLYGSDSPAKLSDVDQIEFGADGKMWIGTAPWGAGRLCQFTPAPTTCDIDYTDADSQGILALALPPAGVPVYGTELGVSIYTGNSATALRTMDHLRSNYVDSFANDPDGNLGVGTDGGIHQFNPDNPSSEWQTFTPREYPAMGGGWIADMAFSQGGTLWAAVINGSASRYENDAWTAYEDIYSYNTVAVDTQDRAWFGDDNYGIIVLNPDSSQAFKLTTAEGLPSDNVQVILVDTVGRVWIGTSAGLAKYQNESLEVIFSEGDSTVANTYIRDLALDPNGSLIIGTYTGIYRYGGNSPEIIMDFYAEGFSDLRLTTVAVDPYDTIWVGTDKGLLYSVDQASWHLYTTKDGLLTNYISALIIDAYGTIWVGGGGSNFDGGGMLHLVP